MKTENYISRNRVLKPSQDFGFLRKEGLLYIEKYGSKLWTDYNAHDPGITILEILAYVITELGYRTDFNIKDILANEKGEIINTTFFPAREILTNAPLTETDYRKLLIDIDGVSNAWFLATRKQTDKQGFYLPIENEIPIYINESDDTLSLSNKDRNGNFLSRLPVRGLNKIKIELDNNFELGDLNTTITDYDFWDEVKNRLVEVQIVPDFNSWNSPKSILLGKMITPGEIKNKEIKVEKGKVYISTYRTSNITDVLEFVIKPYDSAEIENVKTHFSLEKNICAVIDLLYKKKNEVWKVFNSIQSKLHENRNITEDFLCLETIDTLQIAICVDVELASGTNSVDIMAEIQMAIEKVISPPIRFYTLSELLNQGLEATDIFLGPKLEHGFLKDSEIENAELPTCIHSSDIIAALMQIKGVTSVQNLLLSLYDNYGIPIADHTNKKWCLNLSGDVKPIFSAEKSKILLFQKNIPFLLSESNQMLVKQKVEMLKAQIRSIKMNNCTTDFPFPTGTFYQLDEFYSIQDEFPKKYSLGKNKLSEKASEKRKAQVKQLKGYLHFFDQILADFFYQLYNAKNIFNTGELDRTYYLKFLNVNAKTKGEFYTKEIYFDDLEKKISIEKPIDLDTLFETTANFQDRRNRVLDHLMARFDESFNDYVFMMYELNQSKNSWSSILSKDLITDKQNFINEYPTISSQRGLGMDYMNTKSDLDSEFWNLNHRSGYEKRVARLLGINSIILKDLVPVDISSPQTQWTISLETAVLVYIIDQPSQNLKDKWEFAQKYFYDLEYYTIDKHNTSFIIYLVQKIKENNTVNIQKIAKIDKEFTDEGEAYEFLLGTIHRINLEFENFYCLEHLLLRPFPLSQFDSDDKDLLQVCLNGDCKDEANEDPYSFKATIVLPGYLTRFKNINFRRYAEQVFRQEAPAHVLLKICWVNSSDMFLFQKAYKNWLENYRTFRINYCRQTPSESDSLNFVKYHRALLASLKDLNTMYPEGNLYDCQLSETNNPILLGNTSLGTL